MHRIGVAAAAVMLASSLLGGLPVASAAQAAADDETYLVVYNQSAVPTDASASIARAGGQIVQNYDQIGVSVAVSRNLAFRDNVRQDSRVLDAAHSVLGAVRLKDEVENDGAQPAIGTFTDPCPLPRDLTPCQWDMPQIKAPQARAITSGSRSVLVGDIDTGLDYKHPNLKQNIDFGASVSCITGKPDQSPSAWNDDHGHGTHTAGTIAAASTGFGIVGVAPNVRLAVIKAGDKTGSFYPDAVVCAFMWAGTHNIQVTNNSYFADPFYFNCPNDTTLSPELAAQERAIVIAEGRAIRFAQNHGVAVIAAEGNFQDDLANPTQDTISPDNATPVTRPVDKSCLVIPTSEPGVINVTAVGNQGRKSFYSNYGLSRTFITDVTAPGGDGGARSDPGQPPGQLTAAAPNGRVLSTYPPNENVTNKCVRRVIVANTGDADEPTAFYCYLQGTSMAAPHVAGVAALILSRTDEDRDGDLGQKLRRMLDHSTDPIACPSVVDPKVYPPSVNNGAPQTCTGPQNNNSWYGHGQINALKAVTAGEGGGEGGDHGD